MGQIVWTITKFTHPTLPDRFWFSLLHDRPREIIHDICRLRFRHSSVPRFLFFIDVTETSPLHNYTLMPCCLNHLLFFCPRLCNQQNSFQHQFNKFSIPANSYIQLSTDSASPSTCNAYCLSRFIPFSTASLISPRGNGGSSRTHILTCF